MVYRKRDFPRVWEKKATGNVSRKREKSRKNISRESKVFSRASKKAVFTIYRFFIYRSLSVSFPPPYSWYEIQAFYICLVFQARWKIWFWSVWKSFGLQKSHFGSTYTFSKKKAAKQDDQDLLLTVSLISRLAVSPDLALTVHV